MCRIRAEPVCRIKWIRWHGRFSSYRLRRKYTVRSATLQATPQATPWRRFDRTGHGYAGREIPTNRDLDQARHNTTPSNLVLNLLRPQAIQHTVNVGYYAPTARTIINLLCSSRSSTEIGLILANPPSTHPLGLGGCTTPPRCGFAHHDSVLLSLLFKLHGCPPSIVERRFPKVEELD